MSVRMLLAVTLASVMLSVNLWAGAQPEEEDDAAVSVAVPSGDAQRHQSLTTQAPVQRSADAGGDGGSG